MTEHKHDKGCAGGSCNREVCQKPGAVYFNSSTRRYYCRSCSRTINHMCGEVLCTLDDAGRATLDGKDEG